MEEKNYQKIFYFRKKKILKQKILVERDQSQTFEKSQNSENPPFILEKSEEKYFLIFVIFQKENYKNSMKKIILGKIIVLVFLEKA